MVELRIDQEFQDKIPPLTEEEFKQLRENIINDGEVYEPIVVWKGIIVDGHNRWKVIQEFPNIPYRIKEMVFSDKWEAFDWMYGKQLGRRNLTREQKAVLIGKKYEARKHTITNAKGINQHTKVEDGGESCHQPPCGHKTADAIAEEVGVSARNVRESAAFAKGMDALQEVSPEAAAKVLKGGSGASMEKVSELRKASEEERKEFAEKVLNGTIKKNKQQSKEERMTNAKLNESIQKSVDAVRGEATARYTLADALDELTVIEKEFLSKVRRVLDVRGDLIKGNETVRRTVGTWVYDIEKLKGEI